MEQNLAEVKQEIRALLAVRASLGTVLDVCRALTIDGPDGTREALGAVKDRVLWQWDQMNAELDARRKIEGGRNERRES